MINIKPSAAIRNNYNAISQLCKESGQPVYLTKNGEGDLAVMDIATFARRESMLRLREQLIATQEARLSGKNGYSLQEITGMMNAAIEEVLSGPKA